MMWLDDIIYLTFYAIYSLCIFFNIIPYSISKILTYHLLLRTIQYVVRCLSANEHEKILVIIIFPIELHRYICYVLYIRKVNGGVEHIVTPTLMQASTQLPTLIYIINSKNNGICDEFQILVKYTPIYARVKIKQTCIIVYRSQRHIVHNTCM